MTPPTPPSAGAPFGHMLRAAVVPSALLGLLPILGYAQAAGSRGALSAALGWGVALAFFASGMFLMSRLVRSASPHAFFAVAMAVYLGQVIGLLLFLMAFHNASWVHGQALGVAALVVTVAWQVFAMRALRTARVPVYDPPADGPTVGAAGDARS